MSFFYVNTDKNTRWLIVTIVFGTISVMSTNAIGNNNNSSENTKTMPQNTFINKVFVDKSVRVLQLIRGDVVIKILTLFNDSILSKNIITINKVLVVNRLKFLSVYRIYKGRRR